METALNSPEASHSRRKWSARDFEFLLQRSWLALTIAVLLLVPLLWHLSTWQFHRLESRRLHNHEVATAIAQPALAFAEVHRRSETTGNAVPNWTPVWVDVRWQPTTLMARKRWRDDVMGFWAVSPTQTSEGLLLCVRGWVPTTKSAATTPTLPSVPTKPHGVTRVFGWLVHADSGVQPQGMPAGQITNINASAVNSSRADVIKDVFLIVDHSRTRSENYGAASGLFNVTPPKPNEGPHHSYAWQWRAFIVLLLVAWARLVLNEVRVTTARRHQGT